MRVIVPPQTYVQDGSKRGRVIFLAGGITGCPEWQAEAAELLHQDEASSGVREFTLLNPQRPDFPINDPNAAPAQITWEHDHLRMATDILFWFPCETLCPIVLFELGYWLARHVSQGRTPQLFIGCHLEYKRRLDVIVQTSLVAPHLHVKDSLPNLIHAVVTRSQY